MNPLPPNADELVSAYLDGEATPDEITIVESNPALLGRVDDLRAISAQLGAPASVPAAQKEAHISAALDAFDALFASSETTDGAADGDRADAENSAPRLSAVPPVAPIDDQTNDSHPEHAASPAESPAVHSLDAARERRRPRRFNTGVIAAAAAVMLLFVAAAALSFGRGNSSDDVATAADTASSAELTSDDAMDLDDNALSSIEPTEPTVQDFAAEAAQAEDEAMADDDTAAEPEAAAMEEVAPVESEDAEDAGEAADEAMADDEDAMDDDAVDADDDGGASDTAERLTTEPYNLGTFESRTQLKTGLELEDFNVSIDELLDQATAFEAGIIPSCRDEIPELADSEPDQVLAEAFLEDEGLVVAEVYVLTNADLTRDIYVVDRADCTLIAFLQDQ